MVRKNQKNPKKRFFILGRRFLNLLPFLPLLLFNFFSGTIIFFSVCLFSVIWIISKRFNDVDWHGASNSPDMVFAPVSGRVKGVIKTQGNPIRIVITKFFARDARVYLPSKSELIQYLNGDVLKFESENKQDIELRFYRRVLKIRPSLWIRPGDKGKAGACIGRLCWGARVIMALPSDSELLVQKGDQILGGQTPVALLKKL